MAKRLVLVLVVLVVLPQAAAAATVKVRIEGKTQTLFAPTEVTVTASNALDALEQASLLGEFYYHVTQTSFGPYVDQVGRYGGAASSGWVFKVDDKSPPVGADKVQLEGRRHVLWYYADFGPTGGPPTLSVKAAGKGCYTAHALRRQRQAAHRVRSRRSHRLEALDHGGDRHGRLPRPAPRRARARDRHRRGSLERGEVRPALVLVARARRRGLRRRARARHGDALGDARPRRAGRLRRHGARRPDGDAGARARAEGDDALRRPLRPVDRRSRRARDAQRDWFYFVERHRGRPQRGRGDAAARRRRMVGLPRWTGAR